MKLPQHVRITTAFRERLAPMRFGEMLGTEVALSKEFGVARMTLRKAVDALVAEGLLERRAGVGLFRSGGDRNSRRVRFLAGNLLWNSAVRMATGFRRGAASFGVEVEMRDAEGEISKLKAELAALPSSGAAGAAVISIHTPALAAEITRIAASGFPLVVLDEAFDERSGVSSFIADNILGGRLAAERLIFAGHRELAFIGDCCADTVRERWTGFRQLAETEGLKPMCVEIRPGNRLGDWERFVREAIRRLFSRKNPPTGIFCSCDAVARHALWALNSKGVRVPEDVSIIGFDDDELAMWTMPPLTTIKQDFVAIGQHAAKSLLARLAKPSLPAQSVVIPVSVVDRGTLMRRRVDMSR